MIYYVDNINGSPTSCGKSCSSPVLDYSVLPVKAGDSVLFKRGSVYRDTLNLVAGDEENPIIYGAWGEGDMPTFIGSADVSSPLDWIPTERENVWKCAHPTHGSVGNLVFNADECSATLRWEKKDLSNQGDFFDELFTHNCFRKETPDSSLSAGHLYLYSVGNPGEVYSHIEAVDFKEHILCKVKNNVTIDGLKFKNNDFAIAGKGAKNVTVRNCVFENLGGCVWNYELRIRFGNALEFWNIAENILVENCNFKNVYDSCVTHQGPGAKTLPAKNFTVHSCVFDTYGMAAFEFRDKLPINFSFTGNTCLNAGTGFAMLGEEGPRRSEIWPEPMGHHLFLWRIDDATEGGSLLIENNTFGPAPVGAAIYSIIDERAEAQITLKNNRYTRNDTLLIHFGGESFTDLEAYKEKCLKDSGSKYIEAN